MATNDQPANPSAPAQAEAGTKKKRTRKKAGAPATANNGAEGTPTATDPVKPAPARKPRTPRAKKPDAQAPVTPAPAAVTVSTPPAPDLLDGPTSMGVHGVEGWENGFTADDEAAGTNVPVDAIVEEEVLPEGFQRVFDEEAHAQMPRTKIMDADPEVQAIRREEARPTAVVDRAALEAEEQALTVQVPRPAAQTPVVASTTARPALLPAFSAPTPPAAPKPLDPVRPNSIDVKLWLDQDGKRLHELTGLSLQYVQKWGILMFAVPKEHAAWVGHRCAAFDLESNDKRFYARKVSLYRLGYRTNAPEEQAVFVIDHTTLFVSQGLNHQDGEHVLVGKLGWKLSQANDLRRRFGIQPTAPAADATSDGGARASTEPPQGMPGAPVQSVRPTEPARPPTAAPVAATAPVVATPPTAAPTPPRAATQPIPLDRPTAGGVGPNRPAITPAARPAAVPATTAPIVATTTGARDVLDQGTDPIRVRSTTTVKDTVMVRVTPSRGEVFTARMRRHSGFSVIHVPSDRGIDVLNGSCDVEFLDDNGLAMTTEPFRGLELLSAEHLREKVRDPHGKVSVVLNEWVTDSSIVRYMENKLGWRSHKPITEVFKDPSDDSMLRRFTDDEGDNGPGSDLPSAPLAEQSVHRSAARPERQRDGRKGDSLGRSVIAVIVLLMAGLVMFLFYGRGNSAQDLNIQATPNGAVARVPDLTAKPADPFERCVALQQMGKRFDANTCCKQFEGEQRVACAARVKVTVVNP